MPKSDAEGSASRSQGPLRRSRTLCYTAALGCSPSPLSAATRGSEMAGCAPSQRLFLSAKFRARRRSPASLATETLNVRIVYTFVVAVSSNGPVIAYVRVSTEEQALSGLGLDAQRLVLRTEFERRGWINPRFIEDAGRSGKDLNRPGISEALRLLSSGEASTLVVTKVDRLSRSLLDFSHIVATARKQSWQLVVLDLGVDTSTPSGEMLAGIMSTFAQYERRLAGERTSLALQAKKAAGHRLGRPRTLQPEIGERIVLAAEAGQTPTQIADVLNRDAVPTARGGKRWYPSTVLAVLRSHDFDQVAVHAASLGIPRQGGTPTLK